MIAILAMIPLAYATNESDYKYWYKNGLGEYQQCRSQNICAITENTFTVACENSLNLGLTYIPHIDNETACQHGYHHGWVHACLNDGGGQCARRGMMVGQ